MNKLFEDISRTYQQQKEKFHVYREFFKRLNDDLINAFAQKIKFDRCKSFKAKVNSFRTVFISSSFKLRSKSRDFAFASRDVIFFINHNFVNIRLKRSKNDLLENNSTKETISILELKARDFRYSINQNFLSIRLKRSENNLIKIYSIKTASVRRKLFILRQFRINRRFQAIAYCLFY